MTLADEKEKASSERFMLFTVSPKQDITSLLAFTSGVVYSFLSSREFETIKVNGVEFTEVSGTPAVGEWSKNVIPVLGTQIQVGLSSAPDSDTNVVIGASNLYFTGETDRYFHKDPTDTGTDVVGWEGKVDRYPSLSESIKNSGQGVLSISGFTLKLIDTDQEIKSLLSSTTTLNNSDVVAYNCINDVYTKVFIGKIKSIRFDLNSVSLKINDNFSRFNDSATMGDSISEVVASETNYPDISLQSENKPIPYFVGRSSYSEFGYDEGTPGAGTQRFFIEEANEGISIGNDQFVLGRVSSDGVADQSFTISALNQSLSLNGILYITTTGTQNLRIGDAFTITTGDPIDLYCEVINIDTFNILGNIKCKVYKSDGTTYGSYPTVDVSDTVTLSKSIQAVIAKSDGTYSTPIGFDPTGSFYTETTTSGGNKLITIDISEAGGPTLDFDSSGDKLLFTITSAEDPKHYSVMQNIVEKSGLETNATSFLSSNWERLGTPFITTPDSSCFFQIPLVGSTRFPKYISIIENLTDVTNGILYSDGNLEINYDPTVIEDEFFPSSPSRSLDEDVGGKYSGLIEYQDIFTSYKAENRHVNQYMNKIKTFDELVTPGTKLENHNRSEQFNTPKYLNEVDSQKSFSHLMFDGNMLSINTQKRIEYNYSVATDDIDSNLGDTLKLYGGIVIAPTLFQPYAEARIVSLRKSPESINVKVVET